MKRRHLVLAPLAVAGGLAVGWGLMPVRQRRVGAEPLAAEPGRRAVLDRGTAVEPRLIRQRMEGPVVFALNAALHGGVRIDDGRVQQSHLADLPPLAPAVAHALFPLAGTRPRGLPLDAPAVRPAPPATERLVA